MDRFCDPQEVWQRHWKLTVGSVVWWLWWNQNSPFWGGLRIEHINMTHPIAYNIHMQGIPQCMCAVRDGFCEDYILHSQIDQLYKTLSCSYRGDVQDDITIAIAGVPEHTGRPPNICWEYTRTYLRNPIWNTKKSGNYDRRFLNVIPIGSMYGISIPKHFWLCAPEPRKPQSSHSEWLSGWVAGPQSLLRVAEWLSGWLPATLRSGWVAGPQSLLRHS